MGDRAQGKGEQENLKGRKKAQSGEKDSNSQQ